MPRANPEDRPKTYTWSYADISDGFIWHGSSYTIRQWYRTYSSVNTPGYPRRSGMPYHRLPYNPFSMRIIELQDSKADLTRTDGHGKVIAYQRGDTIATDGELYYADDFSYLGATADRADNNAREIAKNSRGGWLQNIAQFHQLEDLAVNTLTRLTRFVRSMRSGDVGGMLQVLTIRDRDLKKIKKIGGNIRRIPEFYLEVQYAWKPLLSDLYSAFNAARDSIENQVYSVTGRATHNTGMKDYVTGTGTGWFKNPSYWKQQVETRCTTHLEFVVNSSFVDSMKSFGLANPLSVAWDVIPYSFVVDWFLPIGQMLDGLDAFAGLDFRRGYRSYKINTVSTVQYEPDSANHVTGFIDPLTKKTVNVARTVLSDFPAIHFPHLKNPISGTHVFESLALFSQALFGR